MKEKILEDKIDIIATVLLLVAVLLLPSIPAEAEKCPRFTEEKCQTVTEFRPGVEVMNEGLNYQAGEVAEPIERNFVTYTHSPFTVAMAILIALSPLSFRLKRELQSRV